MAAADIANDPPRAPSNASSTTDAGTTTTTNVLTVTHKTTGTAAAGFGTGIELIGQNTAGTAKDEAVLRAVLTTATASSEVGALRLALINAGTVPAEGSEQHQWTPTYAISPRFQTSGNGTELLPALTDSTGVNGIWFSVGNNINFSCNGTRTYLVGPGVMGVATGVALRTQKFVAGTFGGAGGDMTVCAGGGETEVFRIDGTNLQLKLAAASETANGTGTVTTGNLAPGTTAVTIKEWWAVRDSSGNARYIPIYG